MVRNSWIMFAAVAVVWCLGAGESRCPAAEPAAETLLRVAPSLEKLIGGMLESEPSQKTRNVRVLLGPIERQARFNVASTPVHLSITEEDSNGWGTVRVQMTVPCKLHYAVDLSRLQPGDVRWDKKRQLLPLRLPAVELTAVEPDLENESTSVSFTSMRWGFLNQDIERDLRSRALHGIRPEARKMSQAQMALIERAARDAVKELFQKVLSKAIPGVAVVVE